MANYYNRRTADYSPLLVHFTKGTEKAMVMAERIGDAHALHQYKGVSALERLTNILRSRTILASPMPFLPNNPEAVCFTECIWDSLTELSRSYSSFGVVFSKKLVFERGGGPALYIRGDMLKALWERIFPKLAPMMAPFDPTAVLKPGVRLDFLHEREWRLPSNLAFEYSDVEFVLVGSINDARIVIEEIGGQHIPLSKFIPMEVYRTIVSAWGAK